MDKPTNKTDYDNIRWYLLHENVNVFIDHEGRWYAEFRAPCLVQNEDNSCRAYSERPEICKGHGGAEGECEFYDYPYREYFSTENEFLRYLKKKNIDWRFKRAKAK
jgi:Fe-S-cluster containining protein